MNGRVAALLVGAALAMAELGACVNLADIAADRTGRTRLGGGGGMRESQLGQIWSGRTREDLEREWGRPSFVLNLPGFPEPTAIVVVFVGKQDNAGCIDAFVVQLDDARTISSYVCR